MNIFIKENPDSGLAVTLRNLNHYFRIIAHTGDVTLDFKAFRLKIVNLEDGDYEAVMTLGKIVLTVLPGEISFSVGNNFSAVFDSEKLKVYVGSGYTLENSIDNAKVMINTLDYRGTDGKGVFTRLLDMEARSMILKASEMVIKGGGSLLITAADTTLQAGNMVNQVNTFSVKAKDAVSLTSVMGGTTVYGGTGVVVSTSSKLVKPVAGTVHIESDRIIGCGSVDLGRMPESVAAKGDHTQKSLQMIAEALKNLGKAIAPVTAFAPSGPCPIGAGGVTLQTEMAAVKTFIDKVTCKDVRVS